MFLLDVNVLIALADKDHVHHAVAHGFHQRIARVGWATCPLTENGFLRIFGHPKYPQGPGSTDAARTVLRSFTRSPGHQFWPDSISLSGTSDFPTLPASKDITDFYLLALAVKHDARLATLDQRIEPALISGGSAAFFMINDEG